MATLLWFLNFYSMHIPYFEQRVTSLRTLANFDMDHDITGMLKIEHESAKVNMINAIISDPYITPYDFEKRPYLLTALSKVGFGAPLAYWDRSPSKAWRGE